MCKMYSLLVHPVTCGVGAISEFLVPEKHDNIPVTVTHEEEEAHSWPSVPSYDGKISQSYSNHVFVENIQTDV